MRFQRAVCIYNPVSGEGTGDARIQEVRDILLANASDVRLAPTQAPHHASKLAREAQESGCDLLVVQGGDGTVNEAVQGLVPTCCPSLLVLAGGTANVFVKEVGLPCDPLQAAGMLPALIERTVTLGRVDFSAGRSRFFLLMCGAGLDAAIASRTGALLKRRLGEAAFWLRGAEQTLRTFPRLRVAHDDSLPRIGPSSFIVISKSRSYGGGLVFTPRANLLSECFQVAQFAGTRRLRYCGYLLAGISARTVGWPGIHHSACTQLSLEPDGAEPVPVQVDGEVAGHLPARVSVSPVSLSLLLPSTYAPDSTA